MSQPAKFEIIKSGRYFSYAIEAEPHSPWILWLGSPGNPEYVSAWVTNRNVAGADNVHARVIRDNEREAKDDG